MSATHMTTGTLTKTRSIHQRIDEIISDASSKLTWSLSRDKNRQSRAFASPITSYCESLIDSVALFHKEVKIIALRSKMKRDQQFFSLLKDVVDEEQELSNVRPSQGDRRTVTPADVADEKALAAAAKAPRAEPTLQVKEHNILNIADLNEQLERMQRDLQEVALQVQQEEVQAAQQAKDHNRKTTMESSSLNDIMEAIFGKVDYDEEAAIVKMNYIVKEIFDTETNYVRDLIRYKELFADALADTNKIMDSATHQVVFGTLPGVVECNQRFLSNVIEVARLQEHVYEQSRIIAEGFNKWEEDFKNSYSPYISKYDTAIESITQWQKNKTVSAFLDKVRDELRDMQATIVNINSFSIIPVQRIPRYRLLLNDLHKKTPKNQYNLRALLNSALDAVCRVADHCNEEVRVGDLEKKAAQLQNLLSVKYLTSRAYLMECSGLRWRKGKNSYTGTLHLFEDCFVLVSERVSMTGRSWKALYFNRDVLDVISASPTEPLQIVRRTNNVEVEFISQTIKNKVHELAKEYLKKNDTSLMEIQPVRWGALSKLARRTSNAFKG